MSDSESKLAIPDVLPARDLLIERTFQPELRNTLRIIVSRLEVIQDSVNATTVVVGTLQIVLACVVGAMLFQAIGFTESVGRFGVLVMILTPFLIFSLKILRGALLKPLCLLLYGGEVRQAASEIMVMVDACQALRDPVMALYEIGFGFESATWEMIHISYRKRV